MSNKKKKANKRSKRNISSEKSTNNKANSALSDVEAREGRFERLYDQLSEYEKNLHIMNQKRIKIGMKCFLIIPTAILGLLFLTGSNKIVFLIMWIISLFGLSFYLIGVEYVDYQLQIKLNEWSEAEKQEVKMLLSVDMIEMGGNIKGNIRQAFRDLKQEVKPDEKHS